MKQAESENPDGEKPDPEPEPQPVRQTRSSGGITRLQTTPGRWMQDEIGWWYQLEDGIILRVTGLYLREFGTTSMKTAICIKDGFSGTANGTI